MSERPSSPDDTDSVGDDGDTSETATGSPGKATAAGRHDSHTSVAASPPPDSRWWYWVAALPLYFAVATVVGFAVGVAAFAIALTGGTGVQYGVWVDMPMRAGAGIGFVVVVLTVMALVAAGMLLSLLFPIAIYLDADAVAETAGNWQPDPALYGLVALAGLVAQPLQVPLAVYYLYERHESEGVP